MILWIYHQQQLSKSTPVTHFCFYFNDPWSSFTVGFINTEQSILVNVTLITNRSHHHLHGRRASRLEFVAECPEVKQVFYFFSFFPPLSSRVTLSSPQATQEDCSACGKWLTNPEQSGSQTGWTLLTAIVTQSFGDIAEERTRALASVISFYTCGNVDWGVIKSTYRRHLYPLFNLAFNQKAYNVNLTWLQMQFCS